MHTIYARILAGSGLLIALFFAGPVFADSDKRPEMEREHMRFPIRAALVAKNPEVVGKITAINGTTLTVVGNTPRKNDDDDKQTYAIDASAAQVFRGSATSTLSTLVVGDTVSVQGTIDGTTVKATSVRTGVVGMGNIMRAMIRKGEDVLERREERREDRKNASTTPLIQGNGQPVVFGTVSAVQGTTLTLVNKSATPYSVDTANATIVKRGATTTIASVAVGDTVTVQGAISGSAVTASAVVDHGSATTTAEKREDRPKLGGIFNRLGGMFSRLFGF